MVSWFQAGFGSRAGRRPDRCQPDRSTPHTGGRGESATGFRLRGYYACCCNASSFAEVGRRHGRDAGLGDPARRRPGAQRCPRTTILATTSLPPASPGVVSAEIPTGGAGSVGIVSSALPGNSDVTVIVPAGGTALRVDVGPAPAGPMAGGDPNAVMSITLDVRNASSGANVSAPVQVGISPPADLTIPANATSVTVNVCNAGGACTPQTFTVDRTDPNKPILR